MLIALLTCSNQSHHQVPPREDGMAVSPLIPSSSITIRVYVPNDGESFAAVRLDHVIHAYKNVMNFVAESQEKVFGPSSSQPCENNANCFPEFADERRAVTLYFFVGCKMPILVIRNGYMCSLSCRGIEMRRMLYVQLFARAFSSIMWLAIRSYI